MQKVVHLFEYSTVVELLEKYIHLSISWKRTEDLHILARTKLVRALALAVGGTHWIISEWCRGYSTISTVAESIVANSTISTKFYISFDVPVRN